MVISEDNYAMLLTEKKFGEFSQKKIIDARTSVQCLPAMSFESRERVDRILESALAAGGTETGAPRDYGFMYQRSFDDPDGHTWEIFHMDESFVQKQ
jgi:predicted lactoylglutathione lyase